MRIGLKAISVLTHWVELLTLGNLLSVGVALQDQFWQSQPCALVEGHLDEFARRLRVSVGLRRWLWRLFGLLGVRLGTKRGDEDTFREGGKESAWRQVLCHTE